MRRGMWVLGLACAASLLSTGCADQNKKLADLQAERDRLQRELDDRDRQLADARGHESDAQRTIDELNRQLAEAQNRSANQPNTAKGWIGMPGFDMISLPGEVLFDSGKCTLRPAGKQALDQVMSDIRGRYADRDIYVFGHTDNDPIKKSGWKDNWELGAQRALTVCRYLVAGGVNPGKLIQANCGENRTRASNGSKDGKQKNRRVEFYAVVKRGTPINEPQANNTTGDGE